MTAQTTIRIAHAENVLVIPALAVKERDGKQYVHVLQGENQVVQKEITTGLSDNNHIEVKNGLKEGEQIVISQMSNADLDAAKTNMRGPRIL